ncbi:MAG: arylsulfatase [Phycisphaeraceae bacterium]|nr:arylsulfatase [Phycisphaeraceae bacterium]
MSSSDRPNLLLICTDHWPGLLTRMAGHPVVMTPTLSQLANNGVWYSNAYTACPSCIPARRSLMTGVTARTHGDRVFNQHLEMPSLPTMAQCFRNGGYQTYAVGKLHVYPQRNRIGFDDVILNEEGRHHLGMLGDDYEQYIADAGYAGQEFLGGQCSNDYNVCPWQLPDHCHSTNWTAQQMCRVIHRRDPGRPAMWYMSFQMPHPPLWPLQAYLDMYANVSIDPPIIGDWAGNPEKLPYMFRAYFMDGRHSIQNAPTHEIELARRAFYATLTHIDHQIRLVIGTLREEGILDQTIIAFTSDHGDMLGDHGWWAKTVMYEMSANVPLVIMPAKNDQREWLRTGRIDDRLVELRDIMPTLLDMAGLDIPSHVEGMSLAQENEREYLYGEHWENEHASRMIRSAEYKLIYYPVGNHFQLFDMKTDRRETKNLADHPKYMDIRAKLTKQLVKNMYGNDGRWINNGQLIGEPDRPTPNSSSRHFGGQRGIRFV